MRCTRCNDSPRYGLEGAKSPVYCTFHKKGTMVEVKVSSGELNSNDAVTSAATAATARWVF